MISDCLNTLITTKEKRIFESLCIFSFDDLFYYFPYKYISSRVVDGVQDLKGVNDDDIISLSGRITNFRVLKGHKADKRSCSVYLSADFYDKNEVKISVLWFKKIDKIKAIFNNKNFCVLRGVLQKKGDKYFFVHPQILNGRQVVGEKIIPCYPANAKARKYGFKDVLLQHIIVNFIKEKGVEDFLPDYILLKYRLLSRGDALLKIHDPLNMDDIHQARRRLKFEELFLLQLKILQGQDERRYGRNGYICTKKDLLEKFCNECISFTLTNSQMEVINEIYLDLISGKQMNRLLQGDVGSGKTVVAFASCLIALGSGYQCAIMAPTEVLAQQHFQKLKIYCDMLGINIAFISSSISVKEKTKIFDELLNGDVRMIVGTHSLLNAGVRFQNLGLVVIDEQHKFGVMQRAVFVDKNEGMFPHMLLMTATPIPRTLALTLYGDYDVSVIKELPMNRKPIKTLHCYESHRLRLLNFVKEKIEQHQQVYFVYPLIEESKKMDLKNAIEGYEALSRYFHDVHVGIIHGDMDAHAKDLEMQYFKKGFTQILVSTTVIEVGIDVPSATVMVIENAERFGLAQLHQLRGRVGRGEIESFCILVTGFNITKKQKVKIKAMVNCSDGFEIANVDLKLRGFGNVFGEEQSGNMKLKIADMNTDVEILECARREAQNILKEIDNYPALKDKILNGLQMNLGNVG